MSTKGSERKGKATATAGSPKAAARAKVSDSGTDAAKKKSKAAQPSAKAESKNESIIPQSKGSAKNVVARQQSQTAEKIVEQSNSDAAKPATRRKQEGKISTSSVKSQKHKLTATNELADGPAKQISTSKSKRPKPIAININEPTVSAAPYVTTLPEFEDDLELLRYFGIELIDSEALPNDQSDQLPPAQANSELIDFAPEHQDDTLLQERPDADPIEELAKLLASAEEAEAIKSNFELLHTLRDEDIALKEVEVIRLNDLSFGQINNAVAHLTDEAHAMVEGKSQVFFHDRSSGKIFGQEVFAFVYDHATIESVDSRVIAAGRAVVYANGGWIGAKDESIVYAKGDSSVQATGDAIIVVEGDCSVEASETVAVLVNSASVRIRLLSTDACIILMDVNLPIPEIETTDKNPPLLHQLVSIDSPLGLEKMMELSFRESQRRERLSWDYS